MAALQASIDQTKPKQDSTTTKKKRVTTKKLKKEA